MLSLKSLSAVMSIHPGKHSTFEEWTEHGIFLLLPNISRSGCWLLKTRCQILCHDPLSLLVCHPYHCVQAIVPLENEIVLLDIA